MIFKLKYKLLGGHVHVRVFAGKNPSALTSCGKLIFREEEWEVFHSDLDAAGWPETYILEEETESFYNANS